MEKKYENSWKIYTATDVYHSIDLCVSADNINLTLANNYTATDVYCSTDFCVKVHNFVTFKDFLASMKMKKI
jgi:hypothetical protein